MGVTVTEFGKTKNGENISLYTIENSNGMKAAITDFGGILVSLFVPDDKGEVKDVVLGLKKGPDYYDNGSFFGATIGRNANRIDDAKCVIDGVTYNFPVNDGKNNLHTDIDEGFHKKLFKASVDGNSVKLVSSQKDMESGFPGNLDFSVTYTLTEDNELKLTYEAVSDKATIINPTNHSYFNLAGHNSGTILDTELTLKCSAYTPVVAGAIPTGEIADVTGTVFDFRTPEKIGTRIDEDIEQLKLVGGYDHNYCIDGYDGSLRLAAVAKAAGRTMEVYTDLPGIQLYAGNFIADQVGKEDYKYTKRTGFCLETQYYPNSANDKNFKQPIFGAGEKFESVTVYKFV